MIRKESDNKFSIEWLMTHNAVPLVFTTLLAVIGIVGFFASIGTKVEVNGARLDEMKNQQAQNEKLFSILNQQVEDKLALVEARTSITCAVKGASISPIPVPTMAKK